ncbi:prolipoprotein diacylglyceryl transferase [Anaerolineales bacterium HSG6]|nr:prolipoprotein diacylglyceryl transferase [Anaerolineales bacterium HSG6]
MLPILNIGPLALPTYPFLLLVAFWSGTWLAAQQAKRFNFDGDYLYNAAIYGLIAGLIGARLWFVLEHWENYAPNISQAFSLSRNAMSVYEGVVFALLAVLIYTQYYKIPLGIFCDAAAPGMVLALIITQIGGFLGDLTLGQPTTMPWGIPIASVTRHPVQLYQTAGCGIILLILFLIRHQCPWSGFQFWLFVALYSLNRLILEIFVANPETIGDGFLAMQVFSWAMLIVALAVMAYNFRMDSRKNDLS